MILEVVLIDLHACASSLSQLEREDDENKERGSEGSHMQMNSFVDSRVYFHFWRRIIVIERDMSRTTKRDICLL